MFDVQRYISNSEALCIAIGTETNAWDRADDDVAQHAVDSVLPFNYLGRSWIAVGRSGIDWSGAHRNHQEWRAQLNRFFQLPALAKSYAQTGDERFAEAARDYLFDWIRVHPCADAWRLAPYDNTLNLSIRVAIWLAQLPAFLGSPAFDAAMLDSLCASVQSQLDALSHQLTADGNWRIAQADTLLTSGLLLDFLPQAGAWRALGVRVLNDAYYRQILPDGTHDERNPGYHPWMTRVFEKFWSLGQAMPGLGLAMSSDVLEKMHDYALASTRPNGALNGLHDCTGAHTGSRPADWDRKRAAFRRRAGLSDALPPPAQHFPHAGQASFRDGWHESATHVTFDATTWGGSHCHLSRNAIQIHAFGRSLLVDPGTLTYEVSDPMMAHCKSTRAHNTLNLNGWNQSMADPERTCFRSLPGYDLASSTYAGGYWPGAYQWGFRRGYGAGIWASHHRTLLWIHDRAVIVLDNFARAFEPDCADPAHATPALESNWQFSAGPLDVDREAKRVVTRHDDANLLMLFPLASEGMRIDVHCGELDPPRGWLPGHGAYQAAPQVTLSYPAMPDYYADLATILVPFAGPRAPSLAVAVRSSPSADVGRLVLEWEDGSSDEVAWTSRLTRAIGTLDDVETDAALLHLQRDGNGRLVQGLAVDATYATPFSASPKPVPGTWRLGRDAAPGKE